MPCYYPIAAVQPFPGAPLQLFKREQIHLRNAIHGRKLEVPCNQCSGCRRRQSLEWALRCTHEAQMHRYNCYITLTYDDNHIPTGYTLRHRDWQLFMKSLRSLLLRGGMGLQHNDLSLPSALGLGGDLLQRINNRRGLYGAIAPYPMSKPIKYYMAGEYGERYGRPHYHALLFGLDFADKLYHGRTKAGEKIYRSQTLERLWTHGYSSIGNVTFASAAYIARYVEKKRTGDGNKTDYEILDLDTGEINFRKKEYNQMSRASGIGKEWLALYNNDVYATDKVITREGRQLRPPRYYDKQYKKLDAARLAHLKTVRELEALAMSEHHTTHRLRVQEEVANARSRHLRRTLDY